MAQQVKDRPIVLNADVATAFGLLPDTLLLVNGKGVILQVKHSRRPLPFLPVDNLPGRPVTTILPPRVAAEASGAIALALATGEVQNFEFSVAKDTGMIYMEARVTKAATDKALIIMRDYSEWQRYENCHSLLLEVAAKVHQVRPLEEIIALASERILAIFGVELVLVVRKEAGITAKVFIAGKQAKDLAACEWPAGEVLVESAMRTGRFQIMKMDDPLMHAWRDQLAGYSVTAGAAFPMKVGGTILGALTVFTGDPDFGRRRMIVQLANVAGQIAMAILASSGRQRLKLLTTGLESAGNAIVITGRNGDIEWVNTAFLELSGYSQEEITGNKIYLLKSGHHSPRFLKTVRQHISAGKIWRGEITNRRKDHSMYTAEVSITPVRDESGKIANFIAIIQDITGRKQNENEMLEAREAVSRAERLSALGIMAAGIAHEINQPLNALKVVADGMLYWYDKGKMPDMTETMKSLREISKDADRIDAIIKHMRSFIYNNASAPPEPCDINTAVVESLSLMGVQLFSHGIKVTTDLAAALPPVLANETQLEQIVINLVANAMQALDSVEIASKEIEIITGYGNNQVFLLVRDNGPGISELIKIKIFDPFFTTKSVGEGMGLGLSVVHSIVTSYGGQITVKNASPEDGACFKIDFPIAANSQKGDGSA